MSIAQSRPRPQGNPAPGGPIFRPWPKWLEIPEDAEPGDILSYAQDVPVEGYIIRKGPRAGTYVKGYTRHIERYFIVPEHFKPKPAPPAPALRGVRWMSLPEYLEHKYTEWEFFEVQDPVYRKDPESDVIDPASLFVWHSQARNLTLSGLGQKEYTPLDGGIALVRAWVLLYNSNKDEYFVFCRTRSLLLTPPEHRKSLEACYKAHVAEGYHDQEIGKWVDGIYEDLKTWASEHTDYIEVREILAWTIWGFPRGVQDREKAPSLTYATGRKEHPHKAPRRGRRKTRLFTRD